MTNYDIAVIGGGASGLTAAITAARQNPKLKIAVLERLSRIGKKILATGNGRCNYTNRNMDLSRFHGSCCSLYGVIQQFNTEEFFRTLGVYGYADEEGRVYPLSNSAAAVLDGLRLEIMKLGIDVICDFNVTNIQKEKKFRIYCDNEFITADSVIVAGGGLSQASLGSDGSMLRLMKNMNINVSPLSPALTGFKTSQELVRSLKGVRVNADVSLLSDKDRLGSECGEVQFGDGTISGICVFNLSCLCSNKKNLLLSLDLLPDMTYSQVCDLLKDIFKIRAEAALEEALSGIFHKRVGMALIKSCTSHALTEKSDRLSDQEIKKIAHKIKNWQFPVSGTAGFEKSQVTAGGVTASETDVFLRSKKIKGLYFCGEMLDIVGDCGGYNLTFAFASGAMAGKTCAEDLYDKNK